MATLQSTVVLDRLLEPVGHVFTADVARRIVALRADEATQARLDDLATRNAEGEITGDEREEYEALVEAGTLIAILQAKARGVLNKAAD